MTDSLLMTPLLERAWRVAAAAHAGQHRKATDIPYLVHPAAVALILQRSGFHDEHLIAAAILHDVVEDTEWDLARLEGMFPAKVLEIVDVLTERKLDAGGRRRTWGDRKTEQVRRIKASPMECRAVWLADKRHNLETIAFDVADGVEVWSRFHAPREKVLANYRAGVEAARHGDPRLERLAGECLQIVDRLEAAAASEPPAASLG
ncbi:MAG: bifunctional (p)ppGpp synthetase/guanosine-3',5'-bis(diphosphate) 3'-pyrophosphohydrolase [Planctomyces sp.]|nr:bifunctional (p)ppGpp synthetase/guanosine-3',5'-bis(diphosphate) 3'-pyrophosphohydrolase [Planctomyces sp.]